MEEKNLHFIENGNGKRRYYYENNAYHLAHSGPISNSYRCAHYGTSKCPVRLTSLWNGQVQENGQSHNHDLHDDELEKAAMRSDIRKLARDTYEEPKNILRDVSRSYSRVVAAQFSGAAVSSDIHRRRMEIGRPKEPESLEKLGELIDKNNEIKKMAGNNYVGAVKPTDGGPGYALIFANRAMLMELNSVKIIEVDGTMKAIPKKPEATQMWIISFRKHNKAFAAVYAYCRGARGELYEAIVRRLIELAPGLKNVKLILSDFEGAELKAWRRVFSEARVQGCLFHLVKAISEYWSKTCKLSKLGAPREAKYLSRSLALLPPYLIEVGIDAIEQVTMRYIDTFPELGKFINYLRTQWQGKAELISTYGNGIRTNNDSEAYNRHYTPRVGGKGIRVFPLLSNLQDVIEDECIDLARLNNGKPISKVKKTKEQYIKDILILEEQRKLLSKILGVDNREIIREEVKKFLKQCLPAAVQAKIDGEQSKSFSRRVEPSVGNEECEQHDDQEYGAKRKKRLPSKKMKRTKQLTAALNPTGKDPGNQEENSVDHAEKNEEYEQCMNDDDIEHDYDVLHYLFSLPGDCD